MLIIGCDYHPGFQQVAYVDSETGEFQERRLKHPEEAERFYRALWEQGVTVRVGMEASGHARWFERLLEELSFELWTGDAAKIRAKRVRKKKTDREDARHILELLVENRFPKIWVPTWKNRDVRQLLWHRHRMVQTRTRIMNQLQAVAINEGVRYKKRLWREAGRKQLESLSLAPWASRRRKDLLEVLDRINPTIAELTQAIEEEAERCPRSRRLMTHPGVGALTAVAFVLIIGANRSRPTWDWFQKKIPAENDGGWDTLVNRVTACFVSCLWKQRRRRRAAINGGATNFSIWRSDAGARLRK
jgi:transposase